MPASRALSIVRMINGRPRTSCRSFDSRVGFRNRSPLPAASTSAVRTRSVLTGASASRRCPAFRRSIVESAKHAGSLAGWTRQAEYHTEGPCRGAVRSLCGRIGCARAPSLFISTQASTIPRRVAAVCTCLSRGVLPGALIAGSTSLLARDDSTLRSAAHSARIHAPDRGEAARNAQMTRGIFLARSATGGNFRGVCTPVWKCAARLADGNAQSPTRRRERRSGAGWGIGEQQ